MLESLRAEQAGPTAPVSPFNPRPPVRSTSPSLPAGSQGGAAAGTNAAGPLPPLAGRLSGGQVAGAGVVHGLSPAGVPGSGGSTPGGSTGGGSTGGGIGSGPLLPGGLRKPGGRTSRGGSGTDGNGSGGGLGGSGGVRTVTFNVPPGTGTGVGSGLAGVVLLDDTEDGWRPENAPSSGSNTPSAGNSNELPVVGLGNGGGGLGGLGMARGSWSKVCGSAHGCMGRGPCCGGQRGTLDHGWVGCIGSRVRAWRVRWAIGWVSEGAWLAHHRQH